MKQKKNRKEEGWLKVGWEEGRSYIFFKDPTRSQNVWNEAL